MPIDHINIESFQKAGQLDAIDIEGSQAVTRGSSPKNGVAQWLGNLKTYKLNIGRAFQDAKVININKNINAIEAFKQSVSKTYGKTMGSEVAKELRAIATQGKPLTGRMVSDALENIERRRLGTVGGHVTRTFCDKQGEFTAEFKNQCKSRLESLGMSPDSFTDDSIFKDISDAVKNDLIDTVKMTDDIDKQLTELTQGTLDKVLVNMAKNKPMNDHHYKQSLVKAGNFTDKFNEMWNKVVGDSPYSDMIDDKMKDALISSAIGNTYKYPELSSDEYTLSEKYAKLDEVVENLFKERVDLFAAIDQFQTASPDCKKQYPTLSDMPDELIKLVKNAYSKTPPPTSSEANKIFQTYVGDINKRSTNSLFTLKSLHKTHSAFDKLMLEDDTLKKFPCSLNKSMFDNALLKVAATVVKDPSLKTKLMDEEELISLAKEPMRHALTELMQHKNMLALESETRGKDNPKAVTALCIGLLGDRLLSDEVSKKEIEGIVEKAEQTIKQAMDTMRGEVKELAKALENPNNRKPIFKCITDLQKHYKALPKKMDSHDKFTTYREMLNTAMESFKWEDIAGLRTGDINLFEISKELLQQDGDEYDQETVRDLGTSSFNVAKGLLAGHGAKFAGMTAPRLPSVSALVMRLGQMYVDKNMPPQPKELQGKATVLGSGQFSTVYKGTYTDGYQGVFKPIEWDSPANSVPGTALGIDHMQPNYHMRNVVARDLEDHFLGSKLLPDCELIKQEGKRGILMEFKPGSDRSTLDRKDTTLRRDMVKLGFLDAFMGQVDRHHNNFTIQSKDGKVVSVCGIDNDLCLGGNMDAESLDPKTGRMIYPGAFDHLNPGGQPLGVHATGYLPPLVEKTEFDAYMKITPQEIDEFVGDRLTPKEVEAIKTRVSFIQGYMQTLQKDGRVLDDGADGFEEAFNKMYDQLASGANCYLESNDMIKEIPKK